jgi:hypothetical protein
MKPAALSATDNALVDKYPEGLIVSADGETFASILTYLNRWDDRRIRETRYEEVPIYCSLAQIPGGFAVRRLDGHDRRDEATGQFLSREAAHG